MRRYSAGEHLSCTISSVRRIIVSQDATISSVITNGSDDFRRLLAFILNIAFRDSVYGASTAGAVISVVAKSPGMMISMNSMSSDQSKKAVGDAGPLMYAIASLDQGIDPVIVKFGPTT